MVLVFIFCAIIILISLLICMLVLSTIRIKIEDFEASNIQAKASPKNYKIIISLYLFNKIKWIFVHLNDKKMRKMYSKMNLEKIDLKKFKKDFQVKDLKMVKKIDPKISYLNLKTGIGVEDVVATSFIIFIISTLIAILLPYTIKKYEKDKYHYEILPLYLNKNAYEIKLDCIIEVKMVHIINIGYVFLKKRRVDKNERTSNRRSYGYSYE